MSLDIDFLHFSFQHITFTKWKLNLVFTELLNFIMKWQRIYTFTAFYNWADALLHRQSNQSRSTNCLILCSYQLLIDFFDINLKPDFNWSRQNRLNCVPLIYMSLNSIERSQICIEIVQNWSKKVKVYHFFQYILTFLIFQSIVSIFISIIFYLILIKRSKLDQKWSTLIKNRSNL